MGILSKLFGKTPTRPSVGGGSGKMSMYALTLQQKGELSSRRCGIDGQTFPCPSVTHTIITADIGGWALDVGGYCPTCRDFRCHNHVEFKLLEGGDAVESAMKGMAYGIACTRCGTRVSGVGS